MNIGERISGRYKIINKIGSGGMANVYLAEDLILEREVAVKMLSLDFHGDERSYRRFQREALSTTELTHPNIVNIYDVGEGNHPYIVMEHVDGLDLKEYIVKNHPVPYNKVINIMDQILSGIAYAHSSGVIHRDIKPHNILIDHDENVKVTDFGIAIAISQNSITQSNSLLGSVQYISPEQARGNIVTEQSDIYSLGIVLYEMLTGNVPFDGESAVSIALKHFQAPIPSLKDFDSRIPQALENVVLKATAKEPKQRYESVSAMREDLLTALDPSRRDEKVFIPIDMSKEDTLVLDDTVAELANTIKLQSPSETVVNEAAEPKNEENPKKKRNRWWLILLPLVLLVILFLVWLGQSPAEVQIPEEIIGMTYDEAVEYLSEHSLNLGERIEEYNDEIEEGVVFRTSPDAGSTVREGAEIDLTVSLGEEEYSIEDYVGENFEEVRAKLNELGFTVQREEEPHESIPEGHITAQDIGPGEEVLISETTIILTVSTGQSSIVLIDFAGLTRDEVNRYVGQHGLNLTTSVEPSDSIPADQVISQDPSPGSELFAGDRISVVFSSGPEEEEAEVFVVGDYTGENYEEIRARLSELGFNVQSQEEIHESIPEGHIIEQNINANEEVQINDTTIIFTISTGRPSIELLDFTGHTETSVSQYVDTHDLNLTISNQASDTVPEGQVISQNPEAGSEVFAGDRISIVFSTGPAEE